VYRVWAKPISGKDFFFEIEPIPFNEGLKAEAPPLPLLFLDGVTYKWDFSK